MKRTYLEELVRELPADLNQSDVDKLLYTVWVRNRIELALLDDEQDDVAHEEFIRISDEWLK